MASVTLDSAQNTMSTVLPTGWIVVIKTGEREPTPTPPNLMGQAACVLWIQKKTKLKTIRSEAKTLRGVNKFESSRLNLVSSRGKYEVFLLILTHHFI